MLCRYWHIYRWFTDVLLENAFHVFGVDVAYGMLDYSIRRNKKVSLIERTNARYLTQTEIEDTISPSLKVSDISLVVIDVSFISVFKILPNLMSLFKKELGIILIKPQFESERYMVDQGGVILNPDYITQILSTVNQQFNDSAFR